jgi:hypothetical protein
MQNHLFKEIPPDERSRYLRDNCDRIEPVTYMKVFDTEELSGFKDELSEVAIEIDSIEQEKKETMEIFKARLDPHKRSYGKLLENIRLKSEEVKEDCFMFIDVTERMVGFYNAKGELVSSRPVRPQEMQKNIFTVDRTGTND